MERLAPVPVHLADLGGHTRPHELGGIQHHRRVVVPPLDPVGEVRPDDVLMPGDGIIPELHPPGRVGQFAAGEDLAAGAGMGRGRGGSVRSGVAVSEYVAQLLRQRPQVFRVHDLICAWSVGIAGLFFRT